MSRKALAMALVAGCFAAGNIVGEEPKVEKAPEIPFQIYGKLHGSLDSIDDGKSREFYLSSNSSRLGIKGDKDLGNDAKVVWQVESLINIDESGTTFASRDTYVGLSSADYGRIQIGRFDTPFKTLGRKTDLFNDMIGDTRNILGAGSSGFDLRADNSIMYISPATAGVIAYLDYRTTDEVAKSDVVSASLTWTHKDLILGAGCEQHGTMVSGTDTNKDGKVDIASSDRELGFRVSAAWKTGDLQVNGLAERVLNAGGTDGANRNTFGGGAAYAIRDVKIKAQYYVSLATDDQPDTGARMLSAGVDYSLSKSTIVYITYAGVQNDAKAKVSMSGGGHGDKVVPATGDNTSGVSVGLAYSF
ncbi:MAG: porin [bacterium]